MKVQITSKGSKLLFDFELEEEDERVADTAKGRVRFGGMTCHVELPFEDAQSIVHPDILALSATLMAYPHIRNTLRLPFPVSRQFADQYYERTGKEVTPVSDQVQPRSAPASGIPALAYSGGVDSTAALSFLPDETVLVFLDRDMRGVRKSLYDKDAAHSACAELKSMGRSVFMISTNLEYLREPTGFPVDIANAVPVLLLADYLDLDSVAFGTVLESAYRVGHELYEDYVDGIENRLWGRGLFEACGVPFNLVTAGLSEVATEKLAEASQYGHLAQSCMRGKMGAPCNGCWKCFRKSLLRHAIERTPLGWEELEAMFSNREARTYLSMEPVKHENVVTYAIERCPGSHEVLAKLERRLAGSWQTTDWMEKWYPKAGELILEKYRPAAIEAILSSVEAMSEAEQKEIEAMDREAYLRSEARTLATREFIDSLARYPDSDGWLARITTWLANGARSLMGSARGQS